MKTIDEIKEFFFTAMLSGWAAASGAKRMIIPNLPGYKAFEFREGGLRLVDCWCVNGDHSAGFTTIWENDIPRWTMHYGGMYPQAAIHVVKRALYLAYEDRQFYGGRGLLLLEPDGPFGYINQVLKKDFHDFCGREAVYNNETRQIVGFHDYWGISLD
ncbi:MAG: hypothetical protein WCT08_05465 [Patescibacteria group bacterium]|jgi:hypothetical protein